MLIDLEVCQLVEQRVHDLDERVELVLRIAVLAQTKTQLNGIFTVVEKMETERFAVAAEVGDCLFEKGHAPAVAAHYGCYEGGDAVEECAGFSAVAIAE